MEVRFQREVRRSVARLAFIFFQRRPDVLRRD